MHRHHADLAALRREVVHGLLQRLGHRTHRHDHLLGILGAVVGERLVFAARDLGDLGHRLGHHVGHGVVELVRSLARLEVDVGVLRRTARHGVLGIQRTAAELAERIAVEEGRERRLVDELDLLDLVRSAESVEEVHEGHARTQRHDVGHARQVHHLLHGRGGQHGEAGLACGHDVLVVAEDRQRLRGQRAGRDMEHAGQQLARDLVHIGDHQQEALRRGEGGGEGTALQRAVHGARGAGLRLHLDDLHGFAEYVLAALCRPLVHQLGHGRGGGDGIDGRHFREHVCHVSRRIVAVTSDEFLFCHNSLKS